MLFFVHLALARSPRCASTHCRSIPYPVDLIFLYSKYFWSNFCFIVIGPRIIGFCRPRRTLRCNGETSSTQEAREFRRRFVVEHTNCSSFLDGCFGPLVWSIVWTFRGRVRPFRWRYFAASRHQRGQTFVSLLGDSPFAYYIGRCVSLFSAKRVPNIKFRVVAPTFNPSSLNY